MSLKRWIWLATLLALAMGAPGVRAQVNVSVAKVEENGNTTYTSGTAVTYRITVTNSGDAVNNVILTDIMSSQFAAYYYAATSLSGISFVSPADGFGFGVDTSVTPPQSPGTISETFNMALGASVVFTVNAVVRVGETAVITNDASIAAPGNTSPNTLSSVTLSDDGNGGSSDLGGTVCAIKPLSSYTVNAVDENLNTYVTPSLSSSITINSGATCLPTTGNNADLRGELNDFNDFGAGDKLLVLQTQDGGSATGTMTTSDDDGYGSLLAVDAGLYEFVTLTGGLGDNGCSVSQLPIRGAGDGLGLINQYFHNPTRNNRRTVQYVRVAQFENLTIGTGTVSAYPWDGFRGGVIAIDARGSIDLGAGGGVKISASCAGFRGGGANPGVSAIANRGITRRTALAVGLGTKGEGLAGTPPRVYEGPFNNAVVPLGAGFNYQNGPSARGAPYNAGGGGNACEGGSPNTSPRLESAGGSGGGNISTGGLGGLCINDIVGGNQNPTGGRNSYPIAAFNFNNANVLSPNISGVREAVGRVTFGGGGGSGASAEGAIAGSGGRGGGIVHITADALFGNGEITSDGCIGQSNDLDGGGGGGGAGGTVVTLVNLSSAGTALAGIAVSATGGAGGDAGVPGGTVDQARGPGGGGSGGRIFVSQLPASVGFSATATTGGVEGTTAEVAGDLGKRGAEDGASLSAVLQLNAFNSVPGVKPGFICATGTVPVTLSFIDAKVQGSELVVNFETASEAGTLGYRVYTDVPGAARMQLNADLVMGKGDSLVPQRYTVRGSYRGAREVWIEEVDVKGKGTVYGPFPIGSPSGEQNIAVSTNWQAIQAEQNAFRTAEAQAIVARRSSTGAVVELRTSRRGWYSVSFEQLAALGVDWNGVETRRIELRRGNRAIPIEVSAANWQAGTALRFYGEQVDGSLYTDSAVYRLQLVAGDAETMRPVYANAGNLSTVSTYLHTLVHAPNRAYGFSSPIDPWYAARILRNANNPGTASETVTVTDRVPGSTARMTLDFWGGTSFAQSPDHAVRVLVNGTPVGEARFDGLVAHSMTVDLPANALIDGANTVAFQLLDDTGAPADIVYLERIAIDYVRNLKLEANGSVAFGAAQGSAGATDGDRIFAGDFSNEGTPACSGMTPGCAAYSVQVGASNTARAFRIRDGIAQPLTAAVTGGVLRFAALSRPGDQFRVETAAAAPALQVAEPLGDLFGGLAAVDYLVVSHPSFSAGLQPLLAARQAEGLRTHVVNVEDLYRAYTGGEFGPAAVEAFLRESHQRWPMLRYVLFVGGDTYDYKNHSGLNSIGFVPTHYRATSEFVRYAPTDTVYADVNGDGVKELAIGRFPVRTAAELANVVAKTLAYPTAGHANQLLWVTDRESNSYNYRNISGNFTAGFTNWTKQFVDLNTYPTSGGAASARGEMVTALNSGKALLGFYGHSSPSSWTREGLLTATLVNGGLFNNATRPTALFQLGCWGAYFVDPQYSSLSHAFLLQPSGAAAVIAATALTEVSSDELFSSVALPALRNGSRIGDVIRDSANAIRLSPTGADALDVTIGTTVLGDPALRINVQQPR